MRVPHPRIERASTQTLHFPRGKADQERGKIAASIGGCGHDVRQHRLVLPERPKQRIVEASRSPEPAEARELVVLKEREAVRIVAAVPGTLEEKRTDPMIDVRSSTERIVTPGALEAQRSRSQGGKYG